MRISEKNYIVKKPFRPCFESLANLWNYDNEESMATRNLWQRETYGNEEPMATRPWRILIQEQVY